MIVKNAVDTTSANKDGGCDGDKEEEEDDDDDDDDDDENDPRRLYDGYFDVDPNGNDVLTCLFDDLDADRPNDNTGIYSSNVLILSQSLLIIILLLLLLLILLLTNIIVNNINVIAITAL